MMLNCPFCDQQRFNKAYEDALERHLIQLGLTNRQICDLIAEVTLDAANAVHNNTADTPLFSERP